MDEKQLSRLRETERLTDRAILCPTGTAEGHLEAGPEEMVF